MCVSECQRGNVEGRVGNGSACLGEEGCLCGCGCMCVSMLCVCVLCGGERESVCVYLRLAALHWLPSSVLPLNRVEQDLSLIIQTLTLIRCHCHRSNIALILLLVFAPEYLEGGGHRSFE